MVSKDLPYFPFYANDFASDGNVEAMTTEAVGAYILLLCKAWRESPPGSIPNNDSTLARWSRMSPDQWAECKPMVLAAFSLGTDNRLHQKRMRLEYDKLCEISNNRSSAGKAGAKRRWQSHGKANGKRMAKPMANDGYSDPDSDPNKKHPPNPPPAGGGDFDAGIVAEAIEPDADARSFAAGWITANAASHLRRGKIDAFSRLVSVVGKDEAVRRCKEPLGNPKIANPFAYALQTLESEQRQGMSEKDRADMIRRVVAKVSKESHA